jgi:hypothetical protein
MGRGYTRLVQLSGRPFLIRILALALLAGATALGVLMVQWANAASRGEEIQLRAVLSVGAARVRREAVDEVWVLTSFLAVSPAELRRGDWQRAEKMVRFWQQSSSFPELLQGAYIIPDIESSQGFVYSNEEQRYVAAPIPAELLGLVRSQIAARKAGSGREQETASEAAGYIVLTAGGQSSDASAAQSPGAVAVRLDLDALYTRLVPDLIGRHLEGFSYRIRDAKAGTVLAQAGTIPAGVRP